MLRRSFVVGLVGITALACGGSTSPVADNTSSGGETSSGNASSSGSGTSSGNGTSSGSGTSGAQGCTTEAMICPDGTAVGRTGPNCTFAPCPPGKDSGTAVTCDSLQQKAEAKVEAVIKANTACNVPDDCTNVPFSADCFSACTRVMSKSGLDKLDAAKKEVNASECKAFKSQDCKFSIPPCAAPLPPKCVDHVCQ